MVLRESGSNLDAGDSAPNFELPGTDGETYTLDSFADSEALLLVVTCNHCPYAKAKFGTLSDLAADYDDVSVVGINPNDEEEYPEDSFERMRELVADGTVAYDAYLRDEGADVAAAYGAECTPDPFLFENTGTTEAAEFRLRYHGRLDEATNPDDDPETPAGDVRTAIDQILAGEDVTVDWNPSRGCSIKWPDD